MPEPSKTIAFRVPPIVEQQIDDLAKAAGQSKGEWVRDQVLQVLGTTEEQPDPPREPIAEQDEGRTNTIEVLQAQMSGSTRYLHDEIANLTDTLRESTRSHRKDLCQLGVVTLDAQGAIEERLDAICCEILDAIDRIQQSQRSHRDTVLRAIGERGAQE